MKPGPHELAKHLPRNAPKERPHPAKKGCRHKTIGTDFRYAVEFSKIKRTPKKAFRPSQGQPDEHYPNIASETTRDHHRLPTTKRNACSATPSPEPIPRIFVTRLQPGTAGHPAPCPDLRRQQRESYGQPSSKSNLHGNGRSFSSVLVTGSGALDIVRREVRKADVTPSTSAGAWQDRYPAEIPATARFPRRSTRNLPCSRSDAVGT